MAYSPVSPAPETALLSLPGHCTGDLWHNAAAQILSQCYPSQYSFTFITVLALQASGSNAHVHIGRQEVNFDYYTEIGIPCLLVKMDVGTEDPDGLIAGMSSILPRRYEDLAKLQGHLSGTRFLGVWPTLPLITAPAKAKDEVEISSSSSFSAPLYYYITTTILMSYLNLNIPLPERLQRLSALKSGLSGKVDPDSPVELEAQGKIQRLRFLVEQKRTASKLPNAPVLLFNYRKGSMNLNQDANDDLFLQVEGLAYKHGMVVIRVTMGLAKKYITDSDFDLFDVTFSDADVLAKRYTARFWSLASHMPELFGFIGSRTGSLDIAAFNGVNCFSWDEPVFEVAAGVADASWKDIYTKAHLEYQVPQYLRLLQQCSIMSIGLLDPESFDHKTGFYAELREEGLERWLGGDREVRPALPRTEAARDTLIKACEMYLEEPSMGIISINLRALWNGVEPATGGKDVETSWSVI